MNLRISNFESRNNSTSNLTQQAYIPANVEYSDQNTKMPGHLFNTIAEPVASPMLVTGH